MDPLTALSLVGTIIQFVDFGSRILKGSHQFYESASGALPANEELELRTRDLSDLVLKLQRPLHADDGSTPSDHAGLKSLQTLCNTCSQVAKELLTRLEGLKVEGKHKAWKSFGHAIKAAWSQREVDNLSSRLLDFRRSLETHVLSNIRNTTEKFSLQQSKRFNELDHKSQKILEALLDSQYSFSKDLQDVEDQAIAIAQMLNRMEMVLKDQHDQTRTLIVDAMKVAVILSGAKEGYNTESEKERAVRIQEDEVRLKALVADNILESLSFKTMADRQEEIAEAHKHTFGWLFDLDSSPSRRAKWSNFNDWLISGNGTYWINGKAGSGKSTLMRYICEAPKTKMGLKSWAGSSPLTICKFFFWNSGTIEQRSQIGLLRSLLHDVLRQHPDLIPIVIPSVWARAYSHAVQPTKRNKSKALSLRFLIQAFKVLVKQTFIPLKLCLFIDGLDEYEGEAADMADLFTDIVASDNIKVCLSSRPLVALEYAFKSSSMLRLQDLTYEDIRIYVDDTLHTNKRFQQLAIEEYEKAPALVQEIVNKADGVFLWVVLVVRSILVGLGNRDEIEDLERRLQELPSDLSALFENMLTKRIGQFYQEKAAALFQIVRASRERNDQIERFFEVPSPLSLLALSFADEKDLNWAMHAPIKPLNELQISIRCNTMEDRLKNCCAGLLEVQGATDGEHGVSRIDIAKPGGRVQYLHRTVKDYLEQPTVWETITAKTKGSDFDPNILLLKSCLLQLKASEFDEMALIPDSTWRCAALGLEHARQSELRKNLEYIPLLDQLDLVMTLLLEETGQTYPGHWARYYQVGDERPFEWNDTTLALAVEYGLCSYLDYKFRQSSENPCEKPGRPLLDYAISQNPRVQRYPVCPRVIAVLLHHGANSNKAYNSTTPWENALAFAYRLQFPELSLSTFGNERVKPDRDEAIDLLCIFGHFINHGADLNESCIVRTGFEDTTERRPVLYIVKEVFRRWYPEESAGLVNLLEQRGASDELMSEFTVYRAAAWKRVREVKIKFW